MRLLPLAALAVGTLIGTTDRADAQYVSYPSAYRSVTVARGGYGGLFRPGYSTQTRVTTVATPGVVSYAAPAVVAPYAAPAYPAVAPAYPTDVVTAGYGPYAAGPVGGGIESSIASLYAQYLGRQPDPQGMQTWVTRYYQLGGDTNRLTQEFAAAAQREVNANNPYYPR